MSQELNQGKVFDFKEHISLLFKAKRRILITVSAFFLLGVVYYLLLEDRYVSTSTFINSDTQGQSTSNIGGLSRLAGINLGGSSNNQSIPVSLYTEVIYSTPFRMRLIESKFKIAGQKDSVIFENYYRDIYTPSPLSILQKYTIGLPQTLWQLIRGGEEDDPLSSEEFNGSDKSIQSISRAKWQMTKRINNQLTFERNDQNGAIIIAVEMPDPDAAAQMTTHAIKLLQEYIIDYKTKKKKEELNYLIKRYDEQRKERDSIQIELAEYRDQNLVLSTSKSKTRLENIENEYNLQNQVLVELATNIETQKLEVERSFPVFQIIEPAIKPFSPEKPSKLLVAILSVFLGLIISIGSIYLQREYRKLKKILF